MNFPDFNENVGQWIEATTWVIAVLGAIFGAVKLAFEVRASRIQRAEELRWRKAQAGKELVDEMLGDDWAQAALAMLDWNGREFDIDGKHCDAVTESDVLGALRTTNANFSPKEAFIRDSFDNLFYFLSIFERSISGRLVDFEDVDYPIDYYVKLMARSKAVIEAYVAEYGFSPAARFLKRFPEWACTCGEHQGSGAQQEVVSGPGVS